MDDSVPDLEAHLGYWLRRVSNHVSGEFARALQMRQVSVAEWVALQQIGSQPNITSGELAERLAMTRGAISKVIDKLEEKKWTQRSPNPEDNRMQWLTLTLEGRQILPELASIADRNDERFFGCLNAGDQATLRALLQKISQQHEWNDAPID